MPLIIVPSSVILTFWSLWSAVRTFWVVHAEAEIYIRSVAALNTQAGLGASTDVFHFSRFPECVRL
jgi:hypothetical protein